MDEMVEGITSPFHCSGLHSKRPEDGNLGAAAALLMRGLQHRPWRAMDNQEESPVISSNMP
jgi:hypothetical protein